MATTFGTFTINRREAYRYARKCGMPRLLAALFAVHKAPMHFRAVGNIVSQDASSIQLGVTAIRD